MVPSNASEFHAGEAKGGSSHRVTGVVMVAVFSSMIVVVLGSIIMYYYTRWLDRPLSWIGIGRRAREKRYLIQERNFHRLNDLNNGTADQHFVSILTDTTLFASRSRSWPRSPGQQQHSRDPLWTLLMHGKQPAAQQRRECRWLTRCSEAYHPVAVCKLPMTRARIFESKGGWVYSSGCHFDFPVKCTKPPISAQVITVGVDRQQISKSSTHFRHCDVIGRRAGGDAPPVVRMLLECF